MPGPAGGAWEQAVVDPARAPYLQPGCPHPQLLPSIFPFAQSSEQ
jgi:hypothetical protein